MDKVKKASILHKRLVPIITIAIFAIILFLRNNVNADTYQFTFGGWTNTFQNDSNSNVTTKWDPNTGKYYYMTYGRTASASIKYRTKWVTITPTTVEKWTFPYENSNYWTEANHETNEQAYNGYTYTLLSIKKETLNNILKARGCETLEEMAAKSSDNTATVYLQSSHIFLNGETPIDTNGTQGFYNYGLSWNKANALGFAAGNYFTGYNVPFRLSVPKKVNVYLQSYTSEGGGTSYTRIDTAGFREVSKASEAGRTLTFNADSSVTFNSISTNGDNDVMNIPLTYKSGTRTYYLYKVLAQAVSNKRYQKTLSSLSGWNEKMGATYDNVSDYASGSKDAYNGKLDVIRGTTIQTNNASNQGNLVVRAIYTSVKRNLTVNYFVTTKNSDGYSVPSDPAKTEDKALSFYNGDTFTTRINFTKTATTKGSTAKFVGPTRYNEAPIYRMVLKDKNGTVLDSWPKDVSVYRELLRAAGYNSNYKSDLAALKQQAYQHTVDGDFTLDLYYVSSEKMANIKVDFKYLDANGNETKPDGLPTGIPATTARIGSTWKLSSASKAAYKQGSYYYNKYYVSYYEQSDLKTTLTHKDDKATVEPMQANRSKIASEFSTLKSSKSYPVNGDITVTITYKAEPNPGERTYTVNKHLLDTSGTTVKTITSTITKKQGVQITTNAPSMAYYNDKNYAWVKGQSTGSFNVTSTTNRSALNGRNFNLDKDTTMDLYYQEASYYTVTAHWINWYGKDILNPQEIDKIEAGKAFNLLEYRSHFRAVIPKEIALDGKTRNRHSGRIEMHVGSSDTKGIFMFDNMDTFSTFKTMKGNVDIYFIYAAQVPITIKYVDNDTGTEIRNDTVLTLSDFESHIRIIRSFESFKEKIADRGYITVNDIRYKYNKSAKFSNFAAGNFAKSNKTLTEVGDSSITLPETGTGNSPTITLYYTPTTDLTVEYRTITGDGFNRQIAGSVTFKDAIGLNSATRLGSKTEWVNAYKETVISGGTTYTLDTDYDIEIDYKGDITKDATVDSIAALKATTVTPTKAITIRIYYTFPTPNPEYKALSVQRKGTDGKFITTRPVIAGWYKKGTKAYLSKLQNADAPDASGSYNWLTNNPTEDGFTSYEYAGYFGVTRGTAEEEIITLGLGNIPAQYLTMNSDTLITIYYKPKYTLTINYYEKGTTIPVMSSKKVTMGYRGGKFIVGSLNDSFFPETINSLYAYADQYQWDSNSVVNGSLATVKQINADPLTSDHTLNLYYEDLPSTYVTIYAADAATNSILASTDSIQQSSQRKLLGDLFANDALGNMLLTNEAPDLTSYGAGKVQYQNQYKIVERNAGEVYDSFKVPTDGLTTGVLGVARNSNVYSKTKNYDVYLYYKRVANVEVVYVNAETGVIAGHEQVKGALIGNNLSISEDLVLKQYTMTGFSGGKTEGYLVGYNKSDNGTYDAGSAPDDYTPVNTVQQVIDSKVLTKNPLTGDYYVYLYYQVPYKITIHYFYNGEERTDMGKILDMTPVKNYRVPDKHVYSSLGNGKLVAWDMAGAKDVDRKLISSVQDFLNDGDAVIPNANQDTDLNLYYRYLEAPTPEPVDQSMDTTKDSDIMDDAGNLDFNSSGEIYDDASDDAVDGYSQAKTYDLARADSGIAGGDKAESAVTTLKYGYAIKYNTYAASRTFTIRIVDEIGEEIGEYSVDRSYLMNKLDYFTILKAKNYQYRNGALDVTNNTVSGDYASYLQDVQTTFSNNAVFTEAPRLGTVAEGDTFGGTTVCEVEYGETKQDERNPMTNQTIDVVPTITISLDTRKNPQMDLDTATEGLVSDYKVDTDELKFVNPFSAETEVILDGNGNSNSVQLSDKATDGNELITSIITHLPVSKTVPNSEYKTDQCKIWYKNALAMTEGSSTPAYAFTSYGAEPETSYAMNSVFVHTPVVLTLDATPTGLVNQSVNGSASSQTLVSLGKDLVVSYSATAEHKGATGYKYRDYSEYSDGKVYLVFPFEILYNGTYYEANTKLAVTYDREHPENNQIVVTVPTWTKTGDATIKAFMYASNAITEDQRQHVGIGGNYHTTEYVAVGQKYVTVLGNVFDFEVYDVSDYPLWHDVFRQTNSLLFKTGSDLVTYKVGQRNWLTESNNQKAEYTLPLMEGSHPTNKNEGTLGTGYAFRFRLKTTGSMYDDNDSIKITPRFYYVPKDGSSRQEVDLYYNGTVDGQKAALVKVGSKLDKKAIKSLTVGDEYLGIPDSELADTAKLLGTSSQSLKAKTVESYTFSSITLPSALRTFVGDNTVPAGAHVTADDLQKSVQEWYGEYYLPSKLYACAKGFDVKGYADSHGLNFDEEFWLKDGYIVVNFTIETVDDGELALSYNAGYPETVNMFKREGAVLNKAASNGTVYDLAYGDVVFYDRSKAAEDNYRSSGTH